MLVAAVVRLRPPKRDTTPLGVSVDWTATASATVDEVLDVSIVSVASVMDGAVVVGLETTTRTVVASSVVSTFTSCGVESLTGTDSVVVVVGVAVVVVLLRPPMKSADVSVERTGITSSTELDVVVVVVGNLLRPAPGRRPPNSDLPSSATMLLAVLVSTEALDVVVVVVVGVGEGRRPPMRRLPPRLVD